MKTIPESLEIHIHHCDGYVTRFVQDQNQYIGKLLELLHPDHIFQQSQIILADEHSLSIYRTDTIARIGVLMKGRLDWAFPMGVNDIVEVAEQVFRSRYHSDGAERGGFEPFRSEDRVVFAQIELANGELLFWEIRVPVRKRLPIDVSMSLHNLFNVHCLFARKQEGGADLLNPANIVRLRFYTGPSAMPPDAMPAHKLSTHLPSTLPNDVDELRVPIQHTRDRRATANMR